MVKVIDDGIKPPQDPIYRERWSVSSVGASDAAAANQSAGGGVVAPRLPIRLLPAHWPGDMLLFRVSRGSKSTAQMIPTNLKNAVEMLLTRPDGPACYAAFLPRGSSFDRGAKFEATGLVTTNKPRVNSARKRTRAFGRSGYKGDCATPFLVVGRQKGHGTPAISLSVRASTATDARRDWLRIAAALRILEQSYLDPAGAQAALDETNFAVDSIDSEVDDLLGGEREIVFTHSWDTCGPGGGAGTEFIFRIGGAFFSRSINLGTGGPYWSLQEALEESENLVVTSATTDVSSPLWSADHVARELDIRLMELGQTIRINGRPWRLGKRGLCRQR